MGLISKSLWRYLTDETPGVPALTDRVLYAPQPGTALVTQCKSALVSDLLASASGVVKQKVNIFTDAQVKAWPAADVPLVVGVVGAILLPLFVTFEINPWFANYVVDGGLTIAMHDEAGNIWLSASNLNNLPGLLSGAGGAIMQCYDVQYLNGGGGSGVTITSSNSRGQGLKLVVDNQGAGNFTGGDPLNVITSYVLYCQIGLV